ncbi:MAG: T9SS type A sorting domain-containing protein [Ignavibacteria bacterium]|nr:T9SS type A sorting domain-containing protein [Ignavibacteria bacterium]
MTDITGRVVATLVNDVLPAGIYSVKWNAAGFPSGIYFYKLVSGNSKDIKKLTLIK